MKKNLALIAVRKGSERIKNKNIKNFCKSSLLEIKVKQAIKCQLIDEVVVSTDCQEMMSISRSLGARVLKRPSYYTSSTVAMNEVYEYLASSVECENIIYLHVTSPLLKDKTLESCISKFEAISNTDYDSLATVETIKKYLWHNGSPVNYDPNFHPRSQDLPTYYSLNFAVNIIKRQKMIMRKNIVGDLFYPYELDEIESVDVDNKIDFDIAEFLYRRKNHDK